MKFQKKLLFGYFITFFSFFYSNITYGIESFQNIEAQKPEFEEFPNFKLLIKNKSSSISLKEFNESLENSNFPSPDQIIYLFEKYEYAPYKINITMLDSLIQSVFNPKPKYDPLRKRFMSFVDLKSNNNLSSRFSYISETKVTPIGIIFRKEMIETLERIVMALKFDLQKQIFASIISRPIIKRIRYIKKDESKDELFTPETWLIRNDFKKIVINGKSHKIANIFFPYMMNKLNINHINYAIQIANNSDSLFREIITISKKHRLKFDSKNIVFPKDLKYQHLFIDLMRETKILHETIDIELDLSDSNV